MNYSQYRVVMFATHGLVAGELPELSQPALALSNPNLTNEKDDGLLADDRSPAVRLNFATTIMYLIPS